MMSFEQLRDPRKSIILREKKSIDILTINKRLGLNLSRKKRYNTTVYWLIENSPLNLYNCKLILALC